jgi:hypothetical protein
MSFRLALERLAALHVPGVAQHYGVEAVPDALTRAHLPALLVLPVEIPDDTLFKERGGGLEPLAFAEGTRTLVCTVNHLLLVAPVGAGAGLRTHLPLLVDLMDAYFDALGADVTLGGALLEPAQVRTQAGVFPRGGAVYHGCAFRHRWVLAG